MKILWKHHQNCQPHVTGALQAGGCLQLVLPMHYNQAQRHEESPHLMQVIVAMTVSMPHPHLECFTLHI